MDVFPKLERFFAVSPHQCQRIGALMILMGSFENLLERTLWSVTNENPAGKRPSTDKLTVSERVRKLRASAEGLSVELRCFSELLCDTADNLLSYRHAIAHGWPTDQQAFVKDPAWDGEVRKRAMSKAAVSLEALDAALDCADRLCMGVIHLGVSITKTSVLIDEPAMANARARSIELLHLVKE